MRPLLYLFLFICLSSKSQDWKVFNKEYRYNYGYNSGQGISNVLFVDSINFPITNISYQFNRVVRRCNNQCYGTSDISVPPSSIYFVPNMPQFLMRSLTLLPNGDVQLSDTTTLVIKPQCTVGQTWTFDAINNKTATCIGMGTRVVFGSLDSIRLVLIDNVDSIILSKSYGILVFPELYNKNKYYRLLGIEGKAYLPNALFGKKLANAWDIYDLQIGQELCNKLTKYDMWTQQPKTTSYCTTYQSKILTKSVSTTGIIYGVTQTVSIVTNTTIIAPCGLYASAYANTLDYGNLNDPNRIENKLYPGMLCGRILTDNTNVGWNAHKANYQGPNFYAQVGMVFEANGITFKGFGTGCNGPFGSLPEFATGLQKQPSGTYKAAITLGATFASGLGFIGDRVSFFEFNEINCGGCSFDFTPANFVSVKEESKLNFKGWYFDPINKLLSTEQIGIEVVEVITLTGTVVKSVERPIDGVFCGELSAGIYLLRYVKNGDLFFEKFLLY